MFFAGDVMIGQRCVKVKCAGQAVKRLCSDMYSVLNFDVNYLEVLNRGHLVKKTHPATRAVVSLGATEIRFWWRLGSDQLFRSGDPV